MQANEMINIKDEKNTEPILINIDRGHVPFLNLAPPPPPFSPSPNAWGISVQMFLSQTDRNLHYILSPYL